MSYAAISIGLFIFIMAYFTMNAPVQEKIAKAPTQAVETSQYCQSVDPADAPTFKAPRDDVSKIGWDDQDRDEGVLIRGGCGGDRHLLKGQTTYRLIRKNVPMTNTDVKHHEFNWDDASCHFDTAESIGINIPEVDTSRFKIFFPEISGEISIDRMLESRTRGGERDLLYFIDYGLVFLLHINPDGSLTELKGGTTQGQSETFVLADVYQDIESGRPDLPEEALSCDTTRGASIVSGPQVLVPQQTTEQGNDQLQLQYFVFGTAAGSSQVVNGWGIHCKPAVYLYPPEKKLVNVQVFPKGELSHTEPFYDPGKGWTVEAYPNGNLFNLINSSPIPQGYLYYESKIFDSEIRKPKKGWVVKPEELKNLFNETLPKLGLNEKEKQDFMDYWLNKLPASPYYSVGLIERGQRDYLETLKVTPTPDTSIRFSFFFEALDTPKVVEEPVIKTPERNGFTLVDWGGMVKLHPGTPFTCSQ